MPNQSKQNKPGSKTPKDSVKAEIPGHSTDYDYVLDWIKESNDVRRAQNELVERSVMSYKGQPSKNRYKRTINEYVTMVNKHDSTKASEIKEACNDIPDKSSQVVHNAVEAVVSMTMGGVGQYEFGPYDPQMKRDDRLIDKLNSAAKFFYIQEKIDKLMPQYIRNAVLSGVAHLHLKHNKKTNRKQVTIVESSQMLTDPKRFKTNCERFIGFTQRESFKNVKERTTKSKSGYFLKTINEAQVYVQQVVNELNSTLTNDATQTYLHDELRRDLDTFYKPIITRVQNRRTGEEANPEYMYDGDEIEVAYVYDLQNDKYFEVINRRYIIVAKDNDLTKSVKCKYTDAEGKEKDITKEVKLDHPFVELPYIKTFWDAYPISPLFYVLDDYDDLCAMESVLYHNLSIMAPLTFVGQSSDAEKVSRVASVAGEVVEGLPQTFGVLNKTHDITPVVTAIQRIEEKIKRTLKAVDPFELQAMIGDRASAKEAGTISGQVAQGVNPFLANIETAMAELGEKFFKMEVIYSDKDKYEFSHNGKYAEITHEEMSGNWELNAKLASSIKFEQEANARRAIELVQFLNGNEAVNQQQFLGTMIPIALNSLVTREQAKAMIDPKYTPMPEEVVAQIKKRAEEEAKKDEVDKLDLSGYSLNDLEAMLAAEGGMPTEAVEGAVYVDEMGNPIDPETGEPIEDPSLMGPAGDMGGMIPGGEGAPVDMAADPSIAAAMAEAPSNMQMPQGLPPELAGEAANEQTGNIYV